MRIPNLDDYRNLNMMTDRETVCDFMEPKPAVPETWHPSQRSTKGWWFLCSIAGRDMEWQPCVLDLQKLHEVEALLTDDGWIDYQNRLAAAVKGVNPIDAINKLIHASVEQKTAALAHVVRNP